ncbi:major facilitator superfamily domain-containing protein 4A-like isoform X2 [Nelusetta ayraudi]|uniref:major facilitator superfamily domain-containing protein 4A-like isoform X2 n=1 Tax=Nelusetta ayraudi TaxID=303726 RepID=UPI003F72066C
MKLLDDHIVLLLRRNLQPTLTYWAAFFSFGLCMSFLGPTILDLRCQTRSSLDQITWVFFSQQLFLLVGSCLGGLFKKTLCSSLSALFSSTLIISLMFAAIPLCGNVVLLSVAVAVVGCAMGVIDTIANLQLVNLYHRDSAVFLQALHFFIGVGALISPLVVDPFLDENNCTLSAGWSSSSPSDPDSELFGSNSSDITASPDNYQYSDYITDELLITRVSYAFWIMALINLPVPAAVLALMYNQRLLPCFSHSPRLLDSSAQRGHPVDNHGVGSLFACCNPNNLRGRPATFFILHALGLLCRLRLHLRSVSACPDGQQGGWWSEQCILGLCHNGETHIYLRVHQIHRTQVAHLQPDGGRCGAAPVVDLLRKPCISVHRDVLGGTVYQQCVPLATGIYRGHPELQRLCYNSPGSQCQHRRDGAAAAGWIFNTQPWELHFPAELYYFTIHRFVLVPAVSLRPALSQQRWFVQEHPFGRDGDNRQALICPRLRQRSKDGNSCNALSWQLPMFLT